MAFTISNGALRQKCILRTTYLKSSHAANYMKSKRGEIESQAQEHWASGTISEDGVIYVDMVQSKQV
ncbi:MAG: hypothetical protein K2W78_02470 [Xanthobacteraceae bacterium]|nr:hypothetical protein [Xanthobacteraceae bacterium]